ncbi:MAG: ATP-binding protein [Desulfobacterota bacterium]|nr:ATP-binding protein [Thermodesulfobacteriota bacterium]
MTKGLKQYVIAVPPWIIIGAVAVLVPIFVFWTLQNISKEREYVVRLLTEKGSALIRSIEAGTRTGMMGMRGGSFRVQRLLSETAQTPDIVYVIVTDASGTILAHSDEEDVGKTHGTGLDLQRISRSDKVQWRQIAGPEGTSTFEVFRRFSPTRVPFRPMHGGRMPGSWPKEMREGIPPEQPEVIFVGLDMGPIEAARKQDTTNTILIAAVLLLIGFAGVFSLFLAQAYRSTRTSLTSLEKELETSRRLASLGRLAAGVAHEIRNPLSSIKGFATYFKERYRDNPEDQKTSEIMIQEVDRLNRVITQLLDFARPPVIQKKRASLQSLIQHSLKMIERQASARAIRLHSHLPSEIKEVELDPDGINQVLLNLYLNAVEAMGQGGTLTVVLSEEEDSRRVKIAVSDTGSGIGKEDLEHIFDPYFTTRQTGTGLGLAIVHKIIEAHGGEVRATSEIGRGTTVTVFLPAAEA